MSTRRARITALAATAFTAAALAAGAAGPALAAPAPQTRISPATFIGRATGYGPTLAAAESAAQAQMLGDYVCKPPDYLASDGQLADGTWWATETANCTAYR